MSLFLGTSLKPRYLGQPGHTFRTNLNYEPPSDLENSIAANELITVNYDQ